MVLKKLKSLIAPCLLAMSAGVAMAQSWPPATVRIVVPYPPGTEPDLLARDLGDTLSKKTGKNFVIDNRPGANSIIGTQEVVKGGSDGSTLLIVDRLAVVTNSFLFSKMPYRWEDALKPVTDLAKVDLYVSVNADFPARNYGELIDYARKNPGKLLVGTGGNGHVMHVGMAMVAQAHGLSFTYVPYKGGAPAMMGLAGGEVNAMMAGAVTMAPYVPSKRIRVLAFGGERRAQGYPDVPTVIEAGGKAGSIPSTAFTLIAPAKVPDEVLTKISAIVASAMDQPALKSSYAERGMDVHTTTPAETLKQMKQEAEKYERVIREAGIRIE